MTHETTAPVQSPVDESDKIELLPCPFCGGEAKLQQRETESLWSHKQVTWSQVGCCECECVGADCCEDYDGSEAVAHWNTRAAASAAPTPPAQKPVAYHCIDGTFKDASEGLKWAQAYPDRWAPLYAAPPAQQPSPIGKVLSEDEMAPGYDNRMGRIVWFGTPAPGLIYAAPPAQQSQWTTEDLKRFCVAFYRWWHNQPGANTEQGFDEWFAKTGKFMRAAVGRDAVLAPGDTAAPNLNAADMGARVGNTVHIIFPEQAEQYAVKVPRDLLADLISLDHDARIQAERRLYVLLGGGA